MDMRKLTLAAMAVLFMTGCGGGRYEQDRAETPIPPAAYDSSGARYAKDDGKGSESGNANAARERIVTEFDTLVPRIVEFYNQKFAEDLPSDEMYADFRKQAISMSGTDAPGIRYDLDGHRLVIEYGPFHGVGDEDALSSYEAKLFGVMPHEVAHWFHDKLLEKYGCRDFSGHVMGENRALDKIKCMIVEGTATYMAKFLNKDESLIGKEEYKSPIDSLMDGKFFPEWVYPAGEELMTPILDKDFKNGIRLTSDSFPEAKTAGDVRAYQAEILRKLDEIGGD